MTQAPEEDRATDPGLGLPAFEPAPRIVAFLGAKGGCGTTLLAANLAASLAGPRPGRPESGVCLADLDFFKGDVAGALGLTPSRTMHELMVDPSRLDADVVRGTAVRHESGLSVLAQPQDLTRVLQVASGEIHQLVVALRAAYDLCIADCGSRADEVAAATALRADLVVLVATPEVAALWNAGRTLDLLRSVGIPLSRLRLVVNRVSRRLPFSLQDASDHLGIPVFSTIARDDATCQSADCAGKLLKFIAPRADVTRDIVATGSRLLGLPAGEPPRAAWSLGGLLPRLLRR